MVFRAHRYPANWPSIRTAIRARADERCECTGECGDHHADGRCAAPNGADIHRFVASPWLWCLASDRGAPGPGWSERSTRVVLTVAHVDHDERNNEPVNLLALCQRCHLQMDRADNARRRRSSRAEHAVGRLPGT